MHLPAVCMNTAIRDVVHQRIAGRARFYKRVHVEGCHDDSGQAVLISARISRRMHTCAYTDTCRRMPYTCSARSPTLLYCGMLQWRVTLDGRPLRTPARLNLHVRILDHSHASLAQVLTYVCVASYLPMLWHWLWRTSGTRKHQPVAFNQRPCHL
jgi:hypothetical protein